VYDHYPTQLRVNAFPIRLTLPASNYGEILYPATAARRGDAHFGKIELRIHSRLRFWQFLHYCEQAAVIKIYPNFANISSLDLLGHKQQAGQLGIHLQQRRGQGIDFHQLREYRRGDALSQIDW